MVGSRNQRLVVDIEAGTVRKITKGEETLLSAYKRLAPMQRATITGLLDLYGSKKAKQPANDTAPDVQPA